MSVHVLGMHGLGDNLHERAIIRQLMARDNVFLETPWPSLFHDLVGQRLTLLHKPTSLRTQAKNAAREAAKFTGAKPPAGTKTMRIWYTADEVRAHGSIFAAMIKSAGCDLATADFRLPIPAAWQSKIDSLIARLQPTKPLLIYRPLVERPEWKGCASRNPDHGAYAELFATIRDRFFVISVADLAPKLEWIVGTQIKADATFHAGDLTFEVLAALTQRAALVFCSAGFATILAQAVGTPAVCVFGGHEDSRSVYAKFAPFLGIDPINSCMCFSNVHACDKRINVPQAMARLQTFVAEHAAPKEPHAIAAD